MFLIQDLNLKLLDKYKYSEALNSFQTENNKIREELSINEESIKLFMQLVQDEKINVLIENYKHFSMLSEYFCIQAFITELDNIYKKSYVKNSILSSNQIKSFILLKFVEFEKLNKERLTN